MKSRNGLTNLKLIIEYDGKNYFGWQRQSGLSDKPTIQHTIEKSLQVLFRGEKITLTGAGRTDAGVHALNQAANIGLSKASVERFGMGTTGLNKLCYSINALLPADIVIKKITKTKEDFHARYSARERIYRYYFSTRRLAVNAGKVWYIKTKFDIDLAKEYCKLLKGKHSFKSLCKNKEDKHNFICVVSYAKVKKLKDGIIEFEISANRFLHSMVRAIAGAMVNVASGKINLKEFSRKFKNGEEIKAQYAPAHALFLAKVNY